MATQAAPPRRRAGLTQERSRDTRRRLVRTAMRLWAERGFETGIEDTTIDEIVQAAGVTKGTFYFHFAHKEEILLELGYQTASLLCEEAVRCVDARRSIEDSLRRVTSALVTSVKTAPPAAVGRAMAEFRRPRRPGDEPPSRNPVGFPDGGRDEDRPLQGGAPGGGRLQVHPDAEAADLAPGDGHDTAVAGPRHPMILQRSETGIHVERAYPPPEGDTQGAGRGARGPFGMKRTRLIRAETIPGSRHGDRARRRRPALRAPRQACRHLAHDPQPELDRHGRFPDPGGAEQGRDDRPADWIARIARRA